jgi:membrane protein implicated in regulation of membrane protease activity
LAVQPLLVQSFGLEPDMLLVAAILALLMPVITQAAAAILVLDLALGLSEEAASALWLVLSVTLAWLHAPSNPTRSNAPRAIHADLPATRADGAFDLGDLLRGRGRK